MSNDEFRPRDGGSDPGTRGGERGPAAGSGDPGGRRDLHTPPPGAGVMNVARWVLFGGLLLLAVLSIGVFVANRRGDSGAASARSARYYCPMHPSYTSDRPGECPICGMSLEPIPKGGITTSGSSDVAGLVPIHLSPQRIQLIGVRTARVERRSAGGNLELVGSVTPDEARLTRVQIRVAGWVQELMVNRTGETVRAGQPLLALYSPELYQSEQEFLIEVARDTTSLLGGPAPPAEAARSLEAARQRLRLLGVPDEEIARLERERTPSTRLVLRSPVTGTVLEKGVTTGQSVGADTPLLTVADLGRLWVLADLYEMDYARVRVGDAARFTADALPGRVFAGRIDFIYPTVSPDTRTLKARVSLANPRHELLPGMFGRVQVARRAALALAVPSEAVVHAGEQNYVFLAHAGGHFEPRRVTLGGGTTGEWVAVLGGVAEGDTVVASASFLIDSESRLKAAISGMGQAPATHPHVEAP